MNQPINRHPFFSEWGILIPVLLLCAIGIIMVNSASAAISQEEYQTLFHYVKKQGLFLGIGLMIMYTAAAFPFRLYKNFAYIILLVSLVLLLAVVATPMGVEAGGAKRWLNLGFAQLQPSEFAKLALILFMGYSLTKKQEMIKEMTIGFIPHVIIFCIVSALIYLQKDMGTIVIMAIICWGMMFVAGVKLRHLLSLSPLLLPIFYFGIWMVDHRKNRIIAYLNPWEHQDGVAYQVVNSLKAIGDGGILGKGVGMGIMKINYLPEPHTDFIFSVIGEETGLVGMLLIICLYGYLIWKGFRIAQESQNTFGSFVATGIALFIGSQAVINMAVCMGLIPAKGLTLPFISYGGSSLITNLAAMGILMNISAGKHLEDAHG